MRKLDLAGWACAVALISAGTVRADTLALDPSSFVQNSATGGNSTNTNPSDTENITGNESNVNRSVENNVGTSAATTDTIDLNSELQFNLSDTFGDGVTAGQNGNPYNLSEILFSTTDPDVSYTLTGSASDRDFQLFLQDRNTGLTLFDFDDFHGVGSRDPMTGQISPGATPDNLTPSNSGTLIANDSYLLEYEYEPIGADVSTTPTASFTFAFGTPTATPLPSSAAAGLGLLGVLTGWQVRRRYSASVASA